MRDDNPNSKQNNSSGTPPNSANKNIQDAKNIANFKSDPLSAAQSLKDLSKNKMAGISNQNESGGGKSLGAKAQDLGTGVAAGAAGGAAGGVVGQQAGSKAGESAGEELGKQAAGAAVDAAKHGIGEAVSNVPLVGGLAKSGTDAIADAAKKPIEGIGGAIGKTAGHAAGGAAGNAAGSQVGGAAASKGAIGLNEHMRGEDRDKAQDKKFDKTVENLSQKGIDTGRNAAKLKSAADALNPATLGAKAAEATAGIGKSLVSGAVNLVKNAGVAVVNAGKAAGHAIASGVSKIISSGASMLSHIGVHGAAATAISATALTGTAVTVPTLTTVAIVNYNKPKLDDKIVCTPNTNDENNSTSDKDDIPESASGDMKKAENKIISVLKVDGYNDAQIAGVLSNFMAEGSFDSSILQYTPYPGVDWGPQNNYMKVGNMSGQAGHLYQNTKEKTEALEYALSNPEATKLNGVGLGQMTPAAPYYKWAKDNKKDWSDPGIQIAYQMSSVSNGKYPWNTYKNATKSYTNPEEAAKWFFFGWEYPGYGGNMSNAPSGVVALWPVHKEYAEQALKDVKAAKIDEAYGKSVLAMVENTVDGGAQNNTNNGSDSDSSSSNDSDNPCDDNGEDDSNEETAASGTGKVPDDAKTGDYWMPSELPKSLHKYVEIDPAQYGLKYGSWTGWEAAGALLELHNPGILTTCTQLSAALGNKLWGITNVMGNGRDVVNNWALKDPKGKISKTPKVGAIFSYTPGDTGGLFAGGNHTGIVSHVFENGDILAVETGVGALANGKAPDAEIGTWDYHIYTKETMDQSGTTYFHPSTKMAKPSGSHYFG